MSDDAIGSDFDFQSGEVFVHGWVPLGKGWVSGFRFQASQVWGDPACYQLPFLQMRCVPFFRYQGQVLALAETEQRIHLWRRWSTVAFVGAGRVADEWSAMGDATTPVNFGFGPRYMIAKAFVMMGGVDVAWGPDRFGWYLTLGNAWIH